VEQSPNHCNGVDDSPTLDEAVLRSLRRRILRRVCAGCGLVVFPRSTGVGRMAPDDLPDLLDLLVIEQIPAEYRLFAQ
jgi:hypothetical protein